MVPASPHAATMVSTSSAMVAAWPRMNLSRSAWLWSISRRRSGGASKTTPSPKIGRHERVGLGLVEHLLGGPEEQLVGLGPGQQHHVASASRNWPTSPHSSRTRRMSPMGSSPQLVEVPVLVVAPRHLRRLAQFDVDGHGVPPLSVGSRRTGASGWTSIMVRCVPRWRRHGGHHGRGHRRRVEEVAVAGQPPADPLVQHLGGRPRDPSPSPISVRSGPGWTIEARTPVPSSSICRARA